MKTSQPINTVSRTLGIMLISNLLNGCSTLPATNANNNDPWENWNRNVHGFNKDFDDTILKPIAKGYQDAVPTPVDTGITNIFSNINDIGVTINDFLQFKFLQGGMDASRFLINSTVGLAGIFDVAKEIDLPKHDEDFGQTLGYWGVPSGSYMVLPFVGASNPRDTVGIIGDALFNPLTYISFFGGFAANAATAGASAVDITDTRSDLMQSEKLIDEASVDRYDFMKNTYLQRRNYLIHDGNPPDDEANDPLSLDGNTNTSGENTPNNLEQASHADTPSDTTNTPTATYQNGVKVIDNSVVMPKQDNPVQPSVIDNSKHILDLTAPDEK